VSYKPTAIAGTDTFAAWRLAFNSWLAMGAAVKISVNAPTVNDDSTDYDNGTLWIHTTPNPNIAYILIDNTDTNAVWLQLGSTPGGLKNDGTTPLIANWDVGSFYIQSLRFISDVAIGTAPLTVTSNTLCTNLNSDKLDDQEGIYYLARANHTGTQLMSTISDAGALATLNSVATGQINDNAVTNIKIFADAITTTKIQNDAVTFAKIANAAANSKLVGSGSVGIGTDYSEISLGTNLSMAGTILNAAGGEPSNGDKGDITVSNLGLTWTIDNNAVTTAKMAPLATASIIGRITVGTGNPEILTPTQARTILNVEDGATATKYIGSNTQIGVAYTLVLTDAGKIIERNNAGANTITVPPNSSVAYPINTIINITQYGVGQTSVVAGVGVIIHGNLKSPGQYKGMTLWKRATDEWILWGGTI